MFVCQVASWRCTCTWHQLSVRTTWRPSACRWRWTFWPRRRRETPSLDWGPEPNLDDLSGGRWGFAVVLNALNLEQERVFVQRSLLMWSSEGDSPHRVLPVCLNDIWTSGCPVQQKHPVFHPHMTNLHFKYLTGHKCSCVCGLRKVSALLSWSTDRRFVSSVWFIQFVFFICSSLNVWGAPCSLLLCCISAVERARAEPQVEVQKLMGFFCRFTLIFWNWSQILYECFPPRSFLTGFVCFIIFLLIFIGINVNSFSGVW